MLNVLSSEESDLIERFTRGDCWLLAIQISRLSDEWQCAEHWLMNHAFCVRQKDDGSWEALDIEGVRPVEEVVAQYDMHPGDPLPGSACNTWDLASEELLMEWSHAGEPLFEGSWEIAYDVAADLIEQASR